jgi:integrase
MTVSFSADVPMSVLYSDHYQPAKHPGDEHRSTRWTYKLELDKFDRYFQFTKWRDQFNTPSRGASLADLFADFEWWQQECSLPAMPHVRLVDCLERGDELVEGAMNWLVELGRRRSTANKIRSHVNAVWNWGARRLRSKERPDNEEYSVDLNAPIAFLPDELDRIIEVCRRRPGFVGDLPSNLWWPMCVGVIHSGGLRIGAARKLPTRKIDLLRGGMHVPAGSQKNRREKWFDLLPGTVTAIRACRLFERNVEFALGDWRFNTNTLRRHFAKILVDAEIFPSVDDVPRELKFHALRKTLASQIYSRAGIQAACDRLDHSSPAVTKRYIDPRYESESRITELVDDPLAPPPKDQRPNLRIADCG